MEVLMIDYLCYVKKQYSKEKEYEKFLVGLTILMLIGYLITGDNLNLLFIFGGLSIMYIFGIPFITYRRERKQGIVEKKKEYIKKGFLSEEFECIDKVLNQVEKYDNANKVGALIETGKKITENELKENLEKHEAQFENAMKVIDNFYFKNSFNKNDGFLYHNLKKADFIKRKAYIEKRIDAINNPAINSARIIGKEWMQLIISVFGGYILGKIDTTLANGQFFSTIELIFMTLICIVFMIMSNVFSKQSLKNEAISYYSIVDILVYERNILNELIMSWNIC
jgi:hypothetical protein